MPTAARQRHGISEASAVDELPATDVDLLRAEVRQLTAQIVALLNGREARLADPAMAQELAAAVKPYVDRLCGLRHLVEPLERIRENREQIHELQAEIAEDVAAVEEVSLTPPDIEAALLTELRHEISAVKRDRRIYVPEGEDTEALDEEPQGEKPALALSEQTPAERLRLILGNRFVGLRRLGEVMGSPFSEAEI
ncbi:MAG: hypothetical protein ABIL09_22880, partial [Gemmatimonadota bacterium]